MATMKTQIDCVDSVLHIALDKINRETCIKKFLIDFGIQ